MLVLLVVLIDSLIEFISMVTVVLVPPSFYAKTTFSSVSRKYLFNKYIPQHA